VKVGEPSHRLTLCLTTLLLAIKATESVLKTLRACGKSALSAPSGEIANTLIKRSCAPSLVMTPEGYMVKEAAPGTSPHRTAAPRRKQRPPIDQFKHEDLTVLLQNINNIYDHRIERRERVEEFIPTMTHGEATHLDSIYSHDPTLNESVIAYNSLLGCPQSKARLQVMRHGSCHPHRLSQVLFVRLRVFSKQYTEGQLSLTEYHKKNMATIKKIVHSQSIGLRSVSDTELKSPKNLSNVSQLLSQADDSESVEVEPPLRMRSHSAEIIQALATSASISSCYPQSFRFVLFMDNSLMLFTPHTDTTAVVVVRGHAKILKKAYSQMREVQTEEARPLSSTDPVPRSDSTEFEYVNPQHLPAESPIALVSSAPVKDPQQRRPSIMSRRHSSSDVQTPRVALSGGGAARQNPGFKTLPLRKPLGVTPTSRPVPALCLTPPQVDAPSALPLTTRRRPQCFQAMAD
jgi:hypothetical protein